jgi:periplasmic protein TonB
MTVPELTQRIQPLHIYLIASLAMHALLLCLPIREPIISSPAQPANRLFAVDLHIPGKAPDNLEAPVEPAPPALSPHTSPAHEPQRASQPPAHENKSLKREATVSLDRLNDADAQYRSYIGHLRTKINTAWQYQQEAGDRGLNGIATVRFSITRNGSLESVTVKRSSGHRMLDDEAVRTIRSAAPFFPFPAEFAIETLHVWASFEYEFSRR